MTSFKLIVRNLSWILGVIAFFSVTGCEEDIKPEEVLDDTFLTLRVDEVFQEKACIRLNHDGDQDDFWYCMITQDMEAAASELIQGKLDEALAADGMITGNAGTNKNVTFDGLSPKTEYRVLASRLTPAGKMTGNVAELSFVTLRDPDVFELHPSWEISYKERRASESDPNQETEVLACTVKNAESKDTYIPCLLTKVDFETVYGGSLRACFEDYVEYLNLQHVKWDTKVQAGSCEHLEDRLRHGDYILFMIGVDAEGELTGYYARTDHTLAQETATDAYRRWVGKWTLSGMYGEEKISYQVEISPDENNLYYRMYGWESTSATDYFKTLPQERPVLLYFEKTTGDAYVVSEELDDFADPALAEFYDFFLYGCVEIDYGGEMTEIPVDVPNIRIARMSLTNDNRAVVDPEIFSFDLDGVHYDAPFIYFNYSYTSSLYAGLLPVTEESKVPGISTMILER